MAIPRGLYDLQANRGSVLIGTSHDTPQFAVEAIVEWWRGQGRRHYGQASELLILADSGGSNGARCRLWKYELQENLVDRFQLAVTVCHYPTGASKWNPIEHRLFSQISKHWAGQPLTDYPTIVRLTGETTTQTGLRVNCALSTKDHPTKIKVSDEQMGELDLLKHPILPDWNYTLFPRINRSTKAKSTHPRHSSYHAAQVSRNTAIRRPSKPRLIQRLPPAPFPFHRITAL
jgi:hypothetical protein